MKSDVWWIRLRGVVAGLCVLFAAGTGAVRAADDLLAEGLRALGESRFEEAASLLEDAAARWLLEDPGAGQLERARRALIGAGQAQRRLGRLPEATRLFTRAVELSGSVEAQVPLRLMVARCQLEQGLTAAAELECEQVLSLELPAAQRLAAEQIRVEVSLQQGHLVQAWERFAAATQDPLAVTEQVKPWATLAETLGVEALEARQSSIATQGFEWVLRHAPVDFDRERSMLGVAWAAAQRSDYRLASEHFGVFFDEFPDSHYARQAELTWAGCLWRNGEEKRAEQVLGKLARSYPEEREALAALEQLVQWRGVEPLGEEFAVVLSRALASGEVSASLAAVILLSADLRADESGWEAAVRLFVEHEEIGPHVGRVLALLHERAADSGRAEAVAIGVLQRGVTAPELTLEPGFEQAMRWLASQQAWGIAAKAVPNVIADGRHERLSAVSLRLLAEAKMQERQTVAARELLEYLAKQRGGDDFYTLLRLAELSLELDSRTESAPRIQDLLAAADGKEQTSLARMLHAQWLIRSAQLPEARSELLAVLEIAEGDLRPRAQWLIGETYVLQRNFTAAIEAYRQVEPLDASGFWTAKALVQAGHAFEQLGRTQEARLCYTTLMRRFADSPHATRARTRLAEISASGTKIR